MLQDLYMTNFDRPGAEADEFAARWISYDFHFVAKSLELVTTAVQHCVAAPSLPRRLKAAITE